MGFSSTNFGKLFNAILPWRGNMLQNVRWLSVISKIYANLTIYCEMFLLFLFGGRTENGNYRLAVIVGAYEYV